MAKYFFRANHEPGVIVTDDCSAHVLYQLSDTRSAVASWGGVMEAEVALGLKPWGKTVKLTFSGFQVGIEPWHELPAKS